MHLDLVADQRLVGERDGFLHQGDGEVRHSDVARQPHALDLAQRAERLAQRNPRVRPMQQQQIDVCEPQPAQTLLGSALELARREVRRPHLGGDEHLVALDAARAQPLPDLALVVIELGGIDMAVAQL
jgi:hypothetical protein